MNSRTSSISHPSPQALRRPSYSSRISSVLSRADHEAALGGPAEHQIDEEIEEIKRYEV
jgi:chloride channel 3/4/5